jgi:hypothetical protein
MELLHINFKGIFKMRTLEEDIKDTLRSLYENPNCDGLFVIENRFVTRAELIEYLELKLLTILNNKKILRLSCTLN